MTSNGSSGMIEQPKQRGWSKDRGFFTVRVWKGPKQFAPGLEAQLRGIGVPYQTVEGFARAIVTAQYGADPAVSVEVPVSLWERQPNRVEKAIYSFKQLTVDLIAKDIEKLQSNVQEKTFSTSGYANQAAAQTWFDLIMKGVDSFIVEQPVLTWTRTASNGYNIATAGSLNNVGRILSVEQMNNLEGAPLYLLDDFSADTPSYATYGYRKSSPIIQQMAEGKIQIVNQYESGQWSKKLYTAET